MSGKIECQGDTNRTQTLFIFFMVFLVVAGLHLNGQWMGWILLSICESLVVTLYTLFVSSSVSTRSFLPLL